MLRKWNNLQPKQPDDLPNTILNFYDYPLLFEPGSSWEYGAGLDWAGLMVMRANNTTLEKFMEVNIWEPLGITDVTFHADLHPELEAKVPPLAYRVGDIDPTSGSTADPDGEVITSEKGIFSRPPVDDLGGVGLYISAPGYQKMLTSICNNDSKLLKPATVDLLFTPSLTPEAEAAWNKKRRNALRQEVYDGALPNNVPITHGLGGMINIEDLDRGRKKGSMCWTGFSNTFWWIDRESGVSGTYWSQLIPHGDPKISEHFAEFERWVYQMIA